MYKAYFDGACSGNPGPMTIKYMVEGHSGETLIACSSDIGEGTNNIAEYAALIKLLKYLKQHGLEEVQIYGDSQLIINQVLKKWKINQRNMQVLAGKAWDLMKDHPGWSISWIRREFNVADGLDKSFC